MGTWLWHSWGDWRLGTRKTIGRGLSTPCKSLKGGKMYFFLAQRRGGGERLRAWKRRWRWAVVVSDVCP